MPYNAFILNAGLCEKHLKVYLMCLSLCVLCAEDRLFKAEQIVQTAGLMQQGGGSALQ